MKEKFDDNSYNNYSILSTNLTSGSNKFKKIYRMSSPVLIQSYGNNNFVVDIKYKKKNNNKDEITNLGKKVHNKYSNDNIKRRLKACYHKYIISFLNNLMKTVLKQTRIRFVKMNSKITKDIGIEYNRILLNKKIKDKLKDVLTSSHIDKITDKIYLGDITGANEINIINKKEKDNIKDKEKEKNIINKKENDIIKDKEKDKNSINEKEKDNINYKEKEKHIINEKGKKIEKDIINEKEKDIINEKEKEVKNEKQKDIINEKEKQKGFKKEKENKNKKENKNQNNNQNKNQNQKEKKGKKLQNQINEIILTENTEISIPNENKNMGFSRTRKISFNAKILL